LFSPILLFFCVIAAGGFLKTYDGLIPLWALLTVLTAISMRGYTANSSFAIQRIMVVAPVIVAHFSIRVIGFKRPIQIAGSYALLALFSFAAIMNIVDPLPVLSTNIKFQAQSVNTYISGEVQKITRMPSFRDSKPVLLYYTDDVWDSNIYDYTCYLAPDVTAHSTYEGEIDRNYDPSGGLILYAKGSARIPESFIQQYGEPETFEQNIRGARVSFQRIIVFPY
jgi:hypothetical protein